MSSGERKLLPRRPLPFVCADAIIAEPSAAPFSARLLRKLFVEPNVLNGKTVLILAGEIRSLSSVSIRTSVSGIRQKLLLSQEDVCIVYPSAFSNLTASATSSPLVPRLRHMLSQVTYPSVSFKILSTFFRVLSRLYTIFIILNFKILTFIDL